MHNYSPCRFYAEMLGKPPLGVVGIDKEIRFFLEVENEYPYFNDLERFVLKPAIEEVNRKTDIHTKHETKREGKGYRVIALIFKIKQKPHIIAPPTIAP